MISMRVVDGMCCVLMISLSLTFKGFCQEDEPTMILKGHRSIVNQIRYNHNAHALASSGVEKVVKVRLAHLAELKCKNAVIERQY